MSHLQVVARAKEEFGRQRAWWIGVVDHESEGHFYLAHNKVHVTLKSRALLQGRLKHLVPFAYR